MLDRQIARIQQSTRTFWGCLIPLHDKLRMRLSWYYKWHTLPISKPIHYLVLIIYTLGLPFAFYNFPQKPQPTKAVTYDFPRWEWSNPNPTGNSLNKVESCEQNGSLWAVGYSGTILKSTNNGANWTQEYSGISKTLTSIRCVSPNKIVTVGDTGTILFFDGISWTAAALSPTTSSNFSGIAVSSSGRYVATGSSGAIYYSDNGISWTAAALSPTTSSNFSGIAVSSSGRYVATGSSGAIYYSDNGISWTAAALSPTTSSSFSTVATVNNHFVTGTYYGSHAHYGDVYYSDDGIIWTRTITADIYTTGAFADPSGNFYVYGDYGSLMGPTKRLYISSNGTDWTSANVSPTFDNTLREIILSSSGRYLAVGATKLYYSDDGINWNTSTITLVSSTYLFGITTSTSNYFAAVGTSGTTYYSSDGITWSKSSTDTGTTADINDLIQHDNRLVAVGDSGKIYYSDNNTTWTAATFSPSPGSNNFYSVVISDTGRYVAVGGYFSNSSAIYYSDNGTNWSAAVLGQPNNLEFKKVYLSQSGRYMAVGGMTSNGVIYYSDDGINWSQATVSPASSQFNDVSSNTDGKWVAVAGSTDYDGAVYYSSDGISWSKATITSSNWQGDDWGFYRVFVTDTQRFIIKGLGFFYSDNSIDWTEPNTNYNSWIGDIKQSSNGLIIGAGSGIVYSVDNGVNWSTSGGETFNSLTYSESNKWIAVGSGSTSNIYRSQNGTDWTSVTPITSNTLYKVIPYSSGTDSGFITVGTSSTILRYHSPANATATKLLVKLPGQSFADGVGVSGTPNAVRAGEAVTATIYAVDANNFLDKGNASTAGFTTTDPNDSNPAPVQLTQGGTCVQTNRQAGDPECGIGTANFTFHTPGSWTITASDTGGVLSSGTSSSITVLPGTESSLYFTSSPPTFTAGSASPALSLGLKDMYGNVVTASDAAHTVSLSSSSSNGRFSTSSSGPWTSTLDISLTAGSASASFYYLDYAAESSTITASSSGLTAATLGSTTTPGAINALNSTCQVSSTSETADNSSVDVTATLLDNLSNKVSGKEVRLSSTRSEDSISQPTSTTNSSGIASGSIKSTKAGDTTITCKDETDGIFISSTPKLTFTPGPVSQLFLSGLSSLVEAGTSQQGTVTLKDRYNNLAANARGKLEFSSSDTKADLPSTHTYTSQDNGSHTFPFVFKGAGDKKLTVAYPSTGASTNYVFSVTPASVSSTHSTISSDKERIKDNGEDKAAITVTLKDSYDNGVKGKEVELKSSRREDSLRTINNISSTKGEATFSLTSQSEGESILTAIDMTDKLVLLDGLSLKIYKSPPIDSLSPAIKKMVETIKKVAQPVGEAAAAVGLLIFAAQGASYLLVLISGSARGKRARPWGIVFDALTGQPVDLAVVRLFEAQTKQLIQTKVTDMEGRFGFSVTPGTYVLSVTKGGYLFPITKGTLSRLVRGEGCYVGSPITIEDKVANLSLSIPLEPEQSTLHLKAKIRLILRNSLETITVTASHIFLPLIIIGLMMALGTAYLVQDTRSYLSAILYVVLLTIFLVRRAKRLHQLGRVIDTHNHPLEGVAIFLYDQEYQNLKATTQSDRHGRFTLFVPQGRYYLALTKEGYLFPPAHQLPRKLKGNIYKGGILELKGPGYVSPMVVMEGEG